MSADVFISYAAKDRDRVALLVEGLQQAGVSVWIDMAGIEVAAMWSKEIVSAIRECKVLLLSISPHSTQSENVVKELALASERKKTIIPIYLEPAEIPETMEYQLAGIQRVEFYEGQEDMALQAVIRALAKLGVAVADEASAAAAGVPNIAAHGVSHSGAGQAPKSEGAAWVKIAASVGGVVVLAAGIFFLGGGGSETAAPLGQTGTNATNTTKQVQPLAKPVTLDTNRVVVLPFKTIGTSGETADLGYGLVSTLTSKLQPLQSLVVIAKESARKFKDSEQSPREIGQALGAGTIVTGEIQTSGDKIQVNIQLIDANTEALGWGSTFTKTKDEFLDLQNEIATQLASELKGGLDAAEARQLAQKATENAEAQAEYEVGRREWNKRSKEGFDNAIKHFEKAIVLDPDYADAYAGLADSYGLMPAYNFASPDDAMPKAKSYAEKAIEKNPNLASAYTSLAWVLHNYEYDWKGAEENYSKAIELNPNYATVNHWFGIFLSNKGRHNKAIETLKKAAELDPQSMIIQYTVGQILLVAEQSEEALKYVERAHKMNPYFSSALWFKFSKLTKVNTDKDIAFLKEAIKRFPDQPMHRKTLLEVYLKMGNREAALEQMVNLLGTFHDTLNNCHFAETFFLLGKPEQGYQWLEKGIQAKESWVAMYGNLPSLKKYQNEPRFRELYKKINHPLYVD
ncbi:TIR domain-containing protein [bacterium]|nr:TIR domain-containing protein [bacterium]